MKGSLLMGDPELHADIEWLLELNLLRFVAH